MVSHGEYIRHIRIHYYLNNTFTISHINEDQTA
ncbi:Uncharacterised protein [Vibrio cholerae]|nr:Uncharacterised protein [Vibrio cholerae]